ncbi:MAG: hypothetical protein HYT69_00935 [Candidatus Zambryskibacteria bacterium]|nr:hypothetical protein [Candidatus Zambryskibacteria bacterium]
MDTSWIIAVLFVVLLLILAYTPVETGQIGAGFLFGRFWRVLYPGPNFVIWPFEKIEYHSTATHQHELPDEPENIDRINDIPVEGKRLPFRVLQSGKEQAFFYRKKELVYPTFLTASVLDQWERVPFFALSDALQVTMADSLHAPLTSEIAVVVEWYLEGKNYDSIENFIRNVTPEAGRDREEEVRKRVEDMTAQVLQGFLGPATLGHAREMSPLFSAILKEKLEILVGEREDPDTGKLSDKPWGIHIRDAYIKSISGGHRVNTAQANAAASLSRKQETINDAEAAARSTIVQADATAHATQVQADAAAHAEIRKGQGEAGRIAAMAKVMSDPHARFIATLDVAEQVLPHAKPIIIQGGGGMGEVIASVLALGQQNLTNSKNAGTTNNP